jgi:hypothetical protein
MDMVTITIQGSKAVFSVRGLHRLLAFRRELEIPLAHILDVRRADPDLLGRWWKGVRLPGTHLPGFLVAGTFYRDGRRTFWDVGRHTENAIQVILADERFAELIIEVADPAAEVARFQAAPLA